MVVSTSVDSSDDFTITVGLADGLGVMDGGRGRTDGVFAAATGALGLSDVADAAVAADAAGGVLRGFRAASGRGGGCALSLLRTSGRVAGSSMENVGSPGGRVDGPGRGARGAAAPGRGG